MRDPEKPETPARETIEPAILRTDISVALQIMKGTRTQRDNVTREAFQTIAGYLVEHFVQRGYEMTALNDRPKAAKKHGWPPPGYNPHLKD